MKKLPLILVGVMVLLFLYLRIAQLWKHESTLTIGTTTITIEIADTMEKQQHGLSGRTSLPAEAGMYFPMGAPTQYAFWMYDMKFPLDIIWIREGKVVDISENVPPPYGSEKPVTVRPQSPADAVLEVNSDFTEKHGVKVGDKVEVVAATVRRASGK